MNTQDRILKIAEDFYSEELGYGAIVNFLHDPEVEKLLGYVSHESTVADCIAIVQKELDKLGNRWSLDSAYLNQAIKNLQMYGADHKLASPSDIDGISQ